MFTAFVDLDFTRPLPFLILAIVYAASRAYWLDLGYGTDPDAWRVALVADYLWDEGTTRPRMMSIGLHARWAGQPARASALKEFIEHALEKGDVWFARRIDIANWWIAHHEEFP